MKGIVAKIQKYQFKVTSTISNLNVTDREGTIMTESGRSQWTTDWVCLLGIWTKHGPKIKKC